MLVCFWSPKGGSGTSVIAAAAALVLAREGPARVADLAGDLPAVLGLAADPGYRAARLVADRARSPDRRARSASRSTRAAVSRCCPSGTGDLAGATPKPARRSPSRCGPIRVRPSSTSGVLGAHSEPALHAFVEVADANVIVVRGCYLALRRAVRVELDRPGERCGVRRRSRPFARRSATSRTCSGVPILATVGVRASTARAVDAGVLPTRLPDALARPAREVLRRVGLPRSRGSSVSVTRPRDRSATRCTAAARRAVRSREPVGRASCASRLDRAPARRGAARHRCGRRRACSTSSSPKSTVSVRLQSLLADPTISEIMVNGPNRVFVERNGRIERGRVRPRRRRDRAHRAAGDRAARSSARSGRADGRCPAGRRLAPARGAAAARARRSVRHDPAVLGADASRSPTSASAEASVALLEAMVRAGWNIVVAGATSAGKTTCANALARAIAPSERDRHDRGDRRAPARASARRAPRSAPGERRGRGRGRACASSCGPRCGCDPIGWWSARCGAARRSTCCRRSTPGHDGSLSTVHANSPADALARLETLVLLGGVALPLAAVRAQLASAIDVIVQVARGATAAREIVEIAEVGRARRSSAARGAHPRSTRRGGVIVAGRCADARVAARGLRSRGGVVAVHTLVVALIGSARSPRRSSERRAPARGRRSAAFRRRRPRRVLPACRARPACARALARCGARLHAGAGGRGVAARVWHRGDRRVRARARGRRAARAPRPSSAGRFSLRAAGQRRARAGRGRGARRRSSGSVPSCASAGPWPTARRDDCRGRRSARRRHRRGSRRESGSVRRSRTRCRRGRASDRSPESRRRPARSRLSATVGGRAADALDGARVVVA